MVETLGSPDDYRRWSFVYAMTNLKITTYQVDSTLVPGIRFHWKRSPIIVCTEDDLTPAKTMRVQAANQALAKCKIPRPRKQSSPKLDRSAFHDSSAEFNTGGLHVSEA